MKKYHPLDWNPEVYLSENYVVLDFETKNRDHGSFVDPENRIVLACWSVGPGHSQFDPKRRGVRSKFGSEYEQGALLEAVRRADFIVAHNAKFELGWLARIGLDLRTVIVFCTQIAEYVIYGNRKAPGGLSLDSTLERRGIGRKMQYVSALIAAGVCPSTMDSEGLEEYCIRDVGRTHRLFLLQRRQLAAISGLNVMYGRCVSTPMLADCETRGVQIDNAQVRIDCESYRGAYGAAEDELSAYASGINWRSTKQVAELVYDTLGFHEVRDYRGQPIRTEGGKRSTSEATLGLLKATDQKQREFKRAYSKLVGVKREVQILEQMLGCVNEDNGRLYAKFNQTVTQNHRLSSTGGKWGLQFQNFPRSFKKLFRARNEGWVVVEGDCPQLEFRVGADLAHDPVARTDILGRVDVHALTSQVTGFSRQDSKPHTFKPLYGGRSGPPRLVAYYDAFRKRYEGIYNHQMGWVYEVLRNKQLTIASGLIFYWPDTELSRSGYITNTPSIFNYPISSFATADISQLSLLLVWHDLDGMASFIVNTVHDSGILEVLQEELDKVKEIMVNCYTVKIYDVLRKLFNHEFSLPLGVGIKAGVNWGVGDEEKNESRLFTFTS